MILSPVDDLARLADQSTARFVAALERVQSAVLGSTDRAAAERALAKLYAETSGMADLLGRRRLLLEADARRGQRQAVSGLYAEAVAIPSVPFAEAVARIAKAEPRLAKSAEAVSRLYRTDRFFAMARSSSVLATAKVQAIVNRALRSGTHAERAIKDIVREGLGDWTRAYAQTVFRTNLNTAYTAGRFSLAKDPMVRDEFPGMRFETAGDSDVRPNHAAADGLLARTDDPVWRIIRPPISWNCRCTTSMASWDDFRAAGMVQKNGLIRDARLPRGAGPDPGFRV